MAVGYTRLKLRIQHSPNSDYTDPTTDELVTASLGQLYSNVMVVEKAFTTAETLPTVPTNASNILIIQNLSSTVTLAASIKPNGGAAATHTIPVNGLAVYVGIDVDDCTIGGTADASATARVWIFAVGDTAA